MTFGARAGGPPAPRGAGPGGPRGFEDVPFWEIETDAARLFGLTQGINLVSGSIQPTVELGKSPLAMAQSRRAVRQSYFYGGVHLRAGTGTAHGLNIEASETLDLFERVFNIAAQMFLDSFPIKLSGFFAPVFYPQVESAIVIDDASASNVGGGAGELYFQVRASNIWTTGIGDIPPVHVSGDPVASTATVTAGSGTLPTPGSGLPVPHVRIDLGLPHNHMASSAWVGQLEGANGPFRPPPSFFPFHLLPGQHFCVFAAQIMRASIVWTEIG